MLIMSASEKISPICEICVHKKTTDIWDFRDVNHERKRENLSNL